MADENEVTSTQQIVKHIINKEPSKMKSVVNKEIAARVMGHIEVKRADIGEKLFGD